MKKYLLILLIILCVTISAYSEVLKNSDIVEMVKAGITDETIIIKIESSEEVEFDTTVEKIIDLNNNGVSEPIIQAMITAGLSYEVDSNKSKDTEYEGIPKFPDFSVLPKEIKPIVGEQYYTRINFYYEKGKHLTTNYSRGTIIPVNTKILLKKKTKDTLYLEIEKEVVKIVNVKDYSKKTIDEIASRYLAETPIPIDNLGKDVALQVVSGQVEIGMTKEQVLMARGYPPAHRTPNIELNRWVYWSSRFGKRAFIFENGRLKEKNLKD